MKSEFRGTGRGATRKSKQRVGERITSGLRSFVESLENGESIPEKFTCHKIILELHPLRHTAESVKMTRELLNISQAVFAQLLGVKPSTVQSWEQGRQVPGDMACRFLDEIHHDPAYWRKRIAKSLRIKARR
jgi:putative transcriptional regulator